MQLLRLRLRGFRCVGIQPLELTFERLTFLLGPNGVGKTAFLHALARMFASEVHMRRIVPSDFHVPRHEVAGMGTARNFWVEADFVFPELVEDGVFHPTVPPHFAHMRMETAYGQPTMRFRLTAQLDEVGEITHEFVYVLSVGPDDEPLRTMAVNSHDRRAIQVHYVPARRDPADHVSYAANTLLGRLLRAANWEVERATVAELSEELSGELSANLAVKDIASRMTAQWQSLHTGTFLRDPAMSFTRSEIEAVLRYVTLTFAPGPDKPAVDFSLLSDGQQSLLYLALVLTAHAVGRESLTGQTTAFDLNRLRPPVFTLLAVEEPENSLTPHHLGRLLTALGRMVGGQDAQAVVATHSPSLMRRVEPERVRYLRLDTERRTTIATVVMPADDDEAHKFVRAALHAYPELYFARLVVLGEGDSEEIVLPRCLRVLDLEADATSISVAPLGGRHVNHFWRLLNGLGIPHVTLLDLDLGRHQGGWGRIKYAANQLLEYRRPEDVGISKSQVDKLKSMPVDTRSEDGDAWLAWLEEQGVFFSDPLDLDFAMIQQLPEPYDVATDEDPPTEAVLTAVLGKAGDPSPYRPEEKALFQPYHQKFKLGSKPAQHLTALASLDDAALKASMPEPIRRLIERVATILSELPE